VKDNEIEAFRKAKGDREKAAAQTKKGGFGGGKKQAAAAPTQEELMQAAAPVEKVLSPEELKAQADKAALEKKKN